MSESEAASEEVSAADVEDALQTGSNVIMDQPPEENTPEQNALIAKLRATLPGLVAKHANPEGFIIIIIITIIQGIIF